MFRTCLKFSVAAALFVALLAPSSVFACNWTWFGNPADFVPADGATIPVNGGIFVAPYGASSPEAEYRLVDEMGQDVDFDLTRREMYSPNSGTVLAINPSGLEAGATYVLETTHTRSVQDEEIPIEITFQTGDRVDLPEELGTLRLLDNSARTITVSNGGSCSWDVEVPVAEIELDLHESAQPWADAFAYETYVDGEPWRPAESSAGFSFAFGQSWVGRRKDRLFAACDEWISEDDVLLPGVHEVQMRAYLPGTDIIWESDFLEVELRSDCGEEPAEEEEPRERPELIDKSPEAPISRPDDDGCSTAGPAGVVPGLLFFVALALLRIRQSPHRFAHSESELD